MWNKSQRGMTLIELIVAMVILSIGLAGVLIVYRHTATSSADPLVRKQMLAIADGMMAEVLRMPFGTGNNGTGSKTSANGCARDTFAELRDYNDYKSDGVCNVAGEAQPGLTAYNVSVSVAQPTGATSLGPIANADLLLISVSVTQGGETLTLNSWRSNYGAQQP